MSDASSSRIGLLRGGVVLAIGALVAACQHEDVRSFQGYAQGETIRLSAPYSGNLSNLAAKLGAKVTEGTTLFSLADESEVAAYNAAKKRLAELQTRRRGPASDTAEIERLKTQVAQTQLKLAQKSANAPADAVVSDAGGAALFVFVKGEGDGGKAKRVAIRRGPAHGPRVEVEAEGLAAGATVVVAGNEGLRDGEPVAPVGAARAHGAPPAPGAGGPPGSPK